VGSWKYRPLNGLQSSPKTAPGATQKGRPRAKATSVYKIRRLQLVVELSCYFKKIANFSFVALTKLRMEFMSFPQRKPARPEQNIKEETK